MCCDGSIGGYRARIRHQGWEGVVIITTSGRFRITDQRSWGRLERLAHSRDIRVGLLQNVLQIVCCGSIIRRDNFCCTTKLIGKGGQSRCFASATLLMKSMIIPVAVINERPGTVFTLTWGPMATTEEVVLPSLAR
jgi:hypothetical protein